MKQETLQLTTGGKKENRRELDYYPTPRECTIALMNFLKLSPSVIWEPACGDGAISEVLKSYGHNVVSSDLFEYGYGHSEVDYLTAVPFKDMFEPTSIPPETRQKVEAKIREKQKTGFTMTEIMNHEPDKKR